MNITIPQITSLYFRLKLDIFDIFQYNFSISFSLSPDRRDAKTYLNEESPRIKFCAERKSKSPSRSNLIVNIGAK